MPKKPARAPASVVEALDAFLSELKPTGANAVRASIARQLASALEAAPPYAVAQLANALGGLVEQLAGDTPGLAAQVAKALSWTVET